MERRRSLCTTSTEHYPYAMAGLTRHSGHVLGESRCSPLAFHCARHCLHAPCPHWSTGASDSRSSKQIGHALFVALAGRMCSGRTESNRPRNEPPSPAFMTRIGTQPRRTASRALGPALESTISPRSPFNKRTTSPARKDVAEPRQPQVIRVRRNFLRPQATVLLSLNSSTSWAH